MYIAEQNMWCPTTCSNSPVVSPLKTNFCFDEPKVIGVLSASKVGLLGGSLLPFTNVPCVCTAAKSQMPDPQRRKDAGPCFCVALYRLQVYEVCFAVFVMNKRSVCPRSSCTAEHDVDGRRLPAKGIVRFAVDRKDLLLCALFAVHLRDHSRIRVRQPRCCVFLY